MITEEQRQIRKRYIGSSDAAAILGMDPYRTAYDVWLEKTGKVDGFEGNAATEAGNLLERACLDWVAPQLSPFDRDVMEFSGDLIANFDGLSIAKIFTVEAKSSGIVGPANAGYGDVTEGPCVEIPDANVIQVHHQMIVAGPCCDIAYVPVLIGGRGFRLYTVPRLRDFAEVVWESGTRFMERHVKTDTPPPDSKPSLEVLKRMRREPNKVISIPDSIAYAWMNAKEAADAANKYADATQADLVAALGDAEAGEFSGGRLTYFQQTVKAHQRKESTFRVLRTKKTK